ncbi:MAG: thiamine-phosphate kinase [Pseudohongiellaceae bacterium]
MAQLEFEIIRKYFRDSGLGFRREGVSLGIGDDCALLDPQPDQQLAISLDLLQEGVHFPESAVPELVAYRALAVNLSDLAAVGAEPWCFTLGLAIPQADPVWLEAFSRGLLDIAKKYNCPLVGGDLIHGTLNIAIQVQGLVPRGKAMLRSAAKPGDMIYVTGTLGDAAIALSIFNALAGVDRVKEGAPQADRQKLSSSHRDFFINRFYKPQPAIAAGILLRDFANACIDLSDGLLNDLGHIVEDSGVGAELDFEQLPYSAAMLASVTPEHRRQAALCGGDDYELCFTVPPDRCLDMEHELASKQITFKRIGEIVSGKGIQCLDSQGEPVAINATTFSHFSEGD